MILSQHQNILAILVLFPLVIHSAEYECEQNITSIVYPDVENIRYIFTTGQDTFHIYFNSNNPNIANVEFVGDVPFIVDNHTEHCCDAAFLENLMPCAPETIDSKGNYSVVFIQQVNGRNMFTRLNLSSINMLDYDSPRWSPILPSDEHPLISRMNINHSLKIDAAFEHRKYGLIGFIQQDYYTMVAKCPFENGTISSFNRYPLTELGVPVGATINSAYMAVDFETNVPLLFMVSYQTGHFYQITLDSRIPVQTDGRLHVIEKVSKPISHVVNETAQLGTDIFAHYCSKHYSDIVGSMLASHSNISTVVKKTLNDQNRTTYGHFIDHKENQANMFETATSGQNSPFLEFSRNSLILFIFFQILIHVRF